MIFLIWKNHILCITIRIEYSNESNCINNKVYLIDKLFIF